MNRLVVDFLQEKITLSSDLVMNILTGISVFTGITLSYEWIMGQNYVFVTFFGIATIGTVCFYIWHRFKNKFPKYKTRKVIQVKYLIIVSGCLIAAAQAGAMDVFLYEGFAKVPGMQVASYFENYKNAGIVLFEIIIPIYCRFMFHMADKWIQKFDNEGLPIFPNLGWIS
ncbi:MAG: hypothetical protein KGH85_07780 [Thaumarchaeota archaeon]|nr:hypothetical protein [Nitrososphaerota archaeon]